MSIFREIPPTAGFPLRLEDIVLGLRARVGKNCLAYDFQKFLNISYAKVTYSGTAAFYLILETIKELTPKRTVVIPAFVCPLVPLAVKRAGFKVEVCDIYKDEFSFSHSALQSICNKSADIAAIVPVHLGGIPIDFDAVSVIARKHGIFTIEDCAQALGAEYNGKKVGTLGDFSFFSLCRGKGLTIYEGGIATTNNEKYARAMEAKSRQIFKNNFLSEAIKIIELLGYSLVYRPQLFWFAYSLPKYFWMMSGNKAKANIEYFSESFPTHKISFLRQKIGHVLFSRLDEEINKQRSRANFYMDKLKEISRMRVLREPRDSRAVYPYVTLVFQDERDRRKIADMFEGSGMGVSQIYTCAITDYAYLKKILPDKDCPNARYAAEHSLTLSTSSFLEESDLRSICNDIINAM
jgi:dTDP-4-amino-4,6-dideoxygalactose transaminase